jgi:hypothetical protein
MVVDDLDIFGSLLRPYEAYAPLIIDADRVLTPAIPREDFQPVRRRGAQIREVAGLMQHVEFPYSLFLDAAELPDKAAHPKLFGCAITKRSDHEAASYIVERYTSIV